MSSLWAERDGRIVHVDEVPQGSACGCSCPACGRHLVARKGPAQKPHFAHAGSGACPTGPSESLRRLAVQAFRERLILTLPPLGLHGFAGDLPVAVSRPVARDQPFDVVLADLPCGDLVPDAVGIVKGRRLAVAFRTLLPPASSASESARHAGVAHLEVDVRDAGRLAPAEIEAWMLLTAPRRWLWHPWMRDMEAEMALMGAADTSESGPPPPYPANP